jgi:hypothetical protein
VGGAAPAGGGRVLQRRTIQLPCPARSELPALAAGQLKHATARVRHYLVNTKNGKNVITINTLPDVADLHQSDLLPGSRAALAPRVMFSLPLSTFAPDYEKFCMGTGLQAKDVSGQQ